MTDTNWKQHHADEADKAVEHPITDRAIAETMRNLETFFHLGEMDGLVRGALLKIASRAASVARAQALGFDPDLLRLTAKEKNSEALRVAAEATLRGVPVYMIEGRDE